MEEEEDQVQIPHDLISEIVLKLPAKSLTKFKIVSKQWLSTINSKQFIKSYISHSSNRPRFLFRTIAPGFDVLLYSFSQDEPISFEYNWNMMITWNRPTSYYHIEISPSIQGFISVRNRNNFSIFNPTTSQCITLPKCKISRIGLKHFFGYDPIKEEYKVLCMTISYRYDTILSQDHQIITVGVGGANRRWRKIECKFPHCPDTNGLCKNGVIYYGAWTNPQYVKYQIMKFDVRLEKFSVINLPHDIQIQILGLSSRIDLFNYKGKLGFTKQYMSEIDTSYDLWVLDDVKKQEWCRVGEIPSLGGYYWCKGSFGKDELLFWPKTYRNYYVLCHHMKTGKRRTIHFQQLVGDVTIDLDHIQNPLFL